MGFVAATYSDSFFSDYTAAFSASFANWIFFVVSSEGPVVSASWARTPLPEFMSARPSTKPSPTRPIALNQRAVVDRALV